MFNFSYFILRANDILLSVNALEERRASERTFHMLQPSTLEWKVRMAV